MALTKADINKISDMIKLTVMAVVSEAIKTVIQDNSINLKQKPINYREKTIKKLEAYNILKHNMQKCEKDIEDLYKEEFGACQLFIMLWSIMVKNVHLMKFVM